MTKERPILFSAPMVRAMLDGRKMQTRRAVKPQPIPVQPQGSGILSALYRQGDYQWPDKVVGCGTISCKPNGPDGWAQENSPYGQPGDRLWVRETWAPYDEYAIQSRDRSNIFYRADDLQDFETDGRWRPSIHMPRWASRILLEITFVRVERLQDISEADVGAEGIQEIIDAGVDHDGTPRDAYRALWESINGAGSWGANPWVWVIEFRRAA